MRGREERSPPPMDDFRSPAPYTPRTLHPTYAALTLTPTTAMVFLLFAQRSGQELDGHIS